MLLPRCRWTDAPQISPLPFENSFDPIKPEVTETEGPSAGEQRAPGLPDRASVVSAPQPRPSCLQPRARDRAAWGVILHGGRSASLHPETHAGGSAGVVYELQR